MKESFSKEQEHKSIEDRIVSAPGQGEEDKRVLRKLELKYPGLNATLEKSIFATSVDAASSEIGLFNESHMITKRGIYRTIFLRGNHGDFRVNYFDNESIYISASFHQ